MQFVRDINKYVSTESLNFMYDRLPASFELEGEEVTSGERCCSIAGGAHWRDCPIYGTPKPSKIEKMVKMPMKIATSPKEEILLDIINNVYTDKLNEIINFINNEVIK